MRNFINFLIPNATMSAKEIFYNNFIKLYDLNFKIKWYDIIYKKYENIVIQVRNKENWKLKMKFNKIRLNDKSTIKLNKSSKYNYKTD